MQSRYWMKLYWVCNVEILSNEYEIIYNGSEPIVCVFCIVAKVFWFVLRYLY